MDETNKRQLKVFLCHAHPDAMAVHGLYARLINDGVDVWLDKESLIPGQDWEQAIRKAVRESDIVIICLSCHFSEKGYRQNEVRVALDEARNQPEGEIFIIPARLEECDYPESLRRYHGVDLFDEKGYDRLMRALRLRAEKIGAMLESRKGWLPKFTTPRPKPIGTKKPEPEVKPAAQKAEPVARKKPEARKWNTQIVIAVIGVLVIIFAAVISGLPWKEWFTPAPTSMPTTSETIETATNIFPTSIITPSLPSKTPTLIFTPTATFTTTPLPEEITDAKGIKMRLVPAGKFMMGSDKASDERPIHEVYLDAYYMDIYEVTNAAYKLCVNANVCNPPKQSGSQTRPEYYGNSEFDEYPVIYVDWNMATTYCEWRENRLPTEAEWEKAARGTEGCTYPWGEGLDCSKANYKGCHMDTTKVGSYESGKSPYGIYDMIGNVWEWVNDWYSDTYYQSSPSSNPLGPDSGTYRVLRGSSWWEYGSLGFRSTGRGGLSPTDISRRFGFRCAHLP